MVVSTRTNQVNQRPASINKNNNKRKSGGNRVGGRRRLGGCCGFRPLIKRSELSPLRLVRRLGAKVAKALRLRRSSSPGISSSGRTRHFVAPIDTHRTEAIEDCIQFINSSSLPRSHSVSTNPT